VLLSLCGVPLLYIVGPFLIWWLTRRIERWIRQPRPTESKQRGFPVVPKPSDPHRQQGT
jgi:hypothetical protein